MSLKWYYEVFFGVEAAKFRTAAFNSLTIATMAAIAATLMQQQRQQQCTAQGISEVAPLAFALINLPIMVPEIVIAVATLIFFSSIGFKTGYLSILLRILYFASRCLPADCCTYAKY